MGEGNKKLSKRDPQAHLLGLPRPGLPARGAAELPRPAGLGDRRGPRHLLPRRDGRGVRHQGRQPQPRALRPQEGRGDQRRAHAAAHARGHDRAGRPVPAARRRWSPTRSPTSSARCSTAAMPLVARADEQAHRGRRHAGLPVRRRGRRSRVDPTDAEKLLDRGRARGRAGGARRARGAGRRGPPTPSRPRCRPTLVDELGLKPRNAFGPVRVAVTGRRISPPLFESLELLGRERGLGRLRRALA